MNTHADVGEIGRPFREPIVMTPWNAKARRRWRRRDIPNKQVEESRKRADRAVQRWREWASR